MILDELAAHARERVAADKAKISLADMKAQAEALPKGDFRFEKALSGKECAFICEVKKASPSKGVIDPVFDFEKIAQSYEQAGADCVSCLTEPKWFLGSDEIFKKVREIVTKADDPQGFYGGRVPDLSGKSPRRGRGASHLHAARHRNDTRLYRHLRQTRSSALWWKRTMHRRCSLRFERVRGSSA